MNVRWPSWLVAVSVVSVLAACTGGGGVAPTTPVSVPATMTTSTSPQPPSTASSPTAVTDEALAIAAVRRHYAELEKALRTRSTVELRKTFTIACTVCKEDAAKIDAFAAAGRTVEGGTFQLTNESVTSHPTDRRIMVRVSLSASAITVRDSAGIVVEKSDAWSGIKDASVYWTGSAWLVEALSR